MKPKRRTRRFKPRLPRGVLGLIERLIEVIDSMGSTSAAAKAIGRSEGALRKWTRGKSEPAASDLRRLCEITGYSAEWVLFGVDLAGRCERENRVLAGPTRLTSLETPSEARPDALRRRRKPKSTGESLMQQQRAREILRALVNGVDPQTGEDLPKGTILEKADVVRALLVSIEMIQQAAARESRRKQLPRNIGRTWAAEENSRLVDSFHSGMSITDIATRHGRTERAIESRLEKLGLITAEQRTTVDRFGSTKKRADGEG